MATPALHTSASNRPGFLCAVAALTLCAAVARADCSVDAGAPLTSLPIGQPYRVYNWIPVRIGTYTVNLLDWQDYIYYSDFDQQLIAFLKFLQILSGVVGSICQGVPVEQYSGDQLSIVSAVHQTTSARGAAGSYGSEPVAGAILAGGASLFASLNGEGDTLTTAALGASAGASPVAGQYSVGPNAKNLISADFNGDGNADLAVSNFGSLSTNLGGNLAIFLGNGDGTFKTGATVNAGPTPVPMAASDFNGDGKIDLAVGSLTAVSFNKGAIEVLLGNGDGTFGEPSQIPLLDVPASIVALDLNGDGKPDLAVLNRNLGTVSIMLGKGDGSFQGSVPYPAGKGTSTYLAATDINGDGKPDLIVANEFASGISFLFGNGDGTFQAPVEYVTGAFPGSFALIPASNGMVIMTIDDIAGVPILLPVSSNGVMSSPVMHPLPQAATGIVAADLNGDGLPDMAVANGGISVLLRNPGAEFSSPANYALQSGSNAVAIATGDFNGDGKTDVVVSSSTNANGGSGGAVDIALNSGAGVFGTPTSYPIGGYPSGFDGQTPSGIVTGDFNGDGKLDVAAGYQTDPGGLGNGGISVLLGNGGGALGAPRNLSVGNFSVYATVAGDFNGDGKLDLIAGVGGSDSNFSSPGAIAFLRGNGDGSFQNAVMINVGSPAGTPKAIASGNVNGDGKLDLVASVQSTNFTTAIVVLLGNGDGTFRQLAPFTTGPPGTAPAGNALALLDLNGDGILDLAVSDCCGLSESVYLLGNGDGTFQNPQYFSSGPSVTAFAVADWNHDGAQGLAIAQQTGLVMAMASGLNAKIAGPGNNALEVTSAAGGVGALAPGSLATAKGTNLATGQPTSPPLPWPLNVQGTSISILDSTGAVTQAPLTYVSSTQVNFQIPDSVASGIATVTLAAPTATSTATVNLQSTAPAVFTLNSSDLAAADGICVSSSNAQTLENVYQVSGGAVIANPLNLASCAQTILLLFATGLDSASLSNVQVTLNGIAATVNYAGPQGTYPGLDQVNVVIPSSLAGSGNIPVVLSVSGQAANTVNLTIQ